MSIVVQIHAGPAAEPAAAEVDNATFFASLDQDMRAEILLQAEESVLQTLPAEMIAEAHMLRERQQLQYQRMVSMTSQYVGRIKRLV